jgi:hypothetical protein
MADEGPFLAEDIGFNGPEAASKRIVDLGRHSHGARATWTHNVCPWRHVQQAW